MRTPPLLADFTHPRACKPICEKSLTLPRPLQGGRYPYVYVDGIYLRRNWGGEFENVAILVAIAVNEDGYREVLGAAEGMKEDKASWVSFFQWLRSRGLNGVKLVVGDKCLGMLEAV